MPSALRDNGKRLMGLPGLNLRDLEKVRGANIMVRRAAKIIRFCWSHGIAGYLENPWSSRLWKARAIRRLLKHANVFLVRCDMCQYGRQWRKPTGLLVWGCSPFILKTCCTGLKCSQTGKAHLMLSGLSGGKFLTAHAQVSPAQFAAANHPKPSPPDQVTWGWDARVLPEAFSRRSQRRLRQSMFRDGLRSSAHVETRI